jgi:hypothetical protein
MGWLLSSARAANEVRVFLVLLCAAPILGLSLYPAILTLEGLHIHGPAAGCFFGRLGNSISYVVPLAAVAMVFIANAVRERSSEWAFAASGVCNFTVTLGYALAVWTAHQRFEAEHAVRLVQLNVVALSLFALAWLAARRIVGANGNAPALLTSQIVLSLVGNALLLLAATSRLFVVPGWSSELVAQIGDPLGWLALVSAVVVWTWARQYFREPSAAFIAKILVALGLMPALSTGNLNQANWLSFHIMIASAVAASTAMLGAGVLIARRRRGVAEPNTAEVTVFRPSTGQPIQLQYQREDRVSGPPEAAALYVGGLPLEPAFLGWTALLTVWTVVLALRAMLGDPQRPWWSSVSTATLALIWVGVACWIMAPRLLYVGVVLVNLAATLWWVEKGWPVLDLLAVSAALLSLFGAACLVLHIQVFRGTGGGWPPLHRFAVKTSTAIVLAIGALIVWRQFAGGTAALVSPAQWAALVTTALLMAAMLGDTETAFAPMGLYLLGLVVVAMGMNQLKLSAGRLVWGYELAAAGFVLVSSMAYALRRGFVKISASIGMPLCGDRLPVTWLAMGNTIVAVVVIALAVHVDFTMGQLPLRLLVASAALVQVLGLVLCSRDDDRIDLRQAVILLATAGAVVFAWAWLPPSSAPIERLVAAMLAISACCAASSAAMRLFSHDGYATSTIHGLAATAKRDGENIAWLQAVRSMLPVVALLWALTAMAVIGTEAFERTSTGTLHVVRWSIICTLVVLPLAAALAIVLALREQDDPLGIPHNRRSAYVYAAEALLAMTFVHLRLTMPWLFGGIFSQYWPLLVMVLAFAGVGLGEAFRRQNKSVLSEPLERTGIFLPLLPVLAFWLAPSRVDFSNLLFVVGFFYAVLSATRKSFLFGVVAALAANGGLWALLYRHPELRFLAHPQLWMIPAAMSVLIAAQLNRDRLPESQLRFIRYACLMLVYVSSTADIFLNGVRDHPWLPLVLAALSVAGVLVGMLFRLRAFLFLGTSFLAIAVVTMIYYASANLHWTWLWYVAGIALGAGIITVFALFEKKRSEMLALVEGLKQWQ